MNRAAVLLLAVLGGAILVGCDVESEVGAPGGPGQTRPAGTLIADGRTAEILALWLDREADPALVTAALHEAAAAGDTRFVAPLIDLLWAASLQRAHFTERHVEVLEGLTGQSFDRSWNRWVEWYGGTELEPVPGYTGWKGRLYGLIDPRFSEFLTDHAPSTIRPELIAWGGVGVDGIPPLDRPRSIPGSEANYLEPDEPVLGLLINGEARAYPFRIMDVHEMANDVLGGVPISIAHCTLCGSAIAYDGRAPEGATYTFSTSGLLYENNKLMYDRQTESLWNQFTGRPVLGPLVEGLDGSREPLLRAFPVVTATWADWLAAHPETTVLSVLTGVGGGYTIGFPYLQYYAGSNPIFPLTQRDQRLHAHDWVYGVLRGGVAQAYDVRLLVRERVLNDSVGGAPLVVVATSERIDVVAFDALMSTEQSYDLGATVRAFERPDGITFRPTDDPLVVMDDTGMSWSVTEEALVAEDGRTAERTYGRQSFWFAWFSFYPDTGLVGGR